MIKRVEKQYQMLESEAFDDIRGDAFIPVLDASDDKAIEPSVIVQIPSTTLWNL